MIKPASNLTKIISVVCIALFVLTFGLASYLPSILKGEVDKNDFTISRSLEYGSKVAIICGLFVAFGLLAYLSYYRGHSLLYFRLFLILVAFAFTITLLWITPDFNMKDHYILDAIIFSSVVIHIITISYVIYEGFLISHKKNKLTNKILLLLIGLPILSIIGIIGLLVSNIPSINNSVPELFPSFENYMLVIQSASILLLGFV